MEIWDINLLNPLSGRKSLDLLKVKCRVLFVCSVNDVTEVQIINKLISADIIHKLHCIPDIELVLRRCLVNELWVGQWFDRGYDSGLFLTSWRLVSASQNTSNFNFHGNNVCTLSYQTSKCSEAAVPELQVLNNGYPTSCMICWMEVR